jgi:hypothetical protein
MAPAPKPFRKARGLTDPEPRDWSPLEKYMLYSKGFSDGAAFRAMRPECKDHPVYDRGYKAGHDAHNKAVNAYCEKIGYTPTILRATGESEK